MRVFSVTAEAENVRISDELHRFDGVSAGNGPDGVAEVAALALVNVAVRVAIAVGSRIVAVPAEVVAVLVRASPKELPRSLVLGVPGEVTCHAGEKTLAGGPPLRRRDGIRNLSQGMNVAYHLSRAVTAVAESHRVLVRQRVAFAFGVTGEAEGLAIVGADGGSSLGGLEEGVFQASRPVGTEMGVVTIEAAGVLAERVRLGEVPVLDGTVAEIAEFDAPGCHLGGCPFFGLCLVAEGAGLLVSAVGRALLQSLAMTRPAEVLPGRKGARFLGSSESPEESMIRFGGVQEVAGGADHLALQPRRASQGERGGCSGAEPLRTGLHEERMQVLFGLVAVIAELGVVPGRFSERDGLFRVHTEAGGLLVAEKTELRVVRIRFRGAGGLHPEQ
jgi:hypothetical protein